MHPRIVEVSEYLDRSRRALREAVDGVPPHRRRESPDAGRWSVANVLEHLTLVERRLTHLIATRLAEARTRGLAADRETTPVVPTLDVATVLDRTRQITASDAVRPNGGLDADGAWAAAEDARHELHRVIRAGDGLALGEVVHPHPVLGPQNLYQWIAFVGAHELRHVAQVREIADQLQGRASNGGTQ